jgi:type I restriction enzyme S subunit
VPKSWCVVPLDNLCKLNEGEPISDMEYPYIDVKGLRTGNYTSKYSGKYVSAGTTLILVDGENSGEVFHTPVEGYQGSTMKVIDIDSNMNSQFVLYFVKLCQRALRENKVGSAIPHLNKKMFRELIIPVPPIEEQGRIVEAIQLNNCILDNISANL